MASAVPRSLAGSSFGDRRLVAPQREPPLCPADILPGSAYVSGMGGFPTTRGTLIKTALIAVPLLAMLVAAGWLCRARLDHDQRPSGAGGGLCRDGGWRRLLAGGGSG